MADITGDNNNNKIHGTDNNDRLKGQGGNDTIMGFGGNDTIDGGDGHDSIDGGAGCDVINGGKGADTIHGGADNDYIDGGSGDGDLLYGDGGNDTIVAGKGKTTIYGGDGNDRIIGGSGNAGNNLYGNDGDDTIIGSQGPDTIAGGAGDDSIVAGDADDAISGGSGNDTIYGGKGDDVICGDDGNDVIYGGDGADKIYGGQGDDLMFGGQGGSGSADGADEFYVGLGGGNDTVYGGVKHSGSGGTGSGSGYDHNDILYVEGPVQVTLQSGETFTLGTGESRNLVNEHDGIDDDLQDGGTATLSDGTVVSFDDIGKISSIDKIVKPEEVICFTPGTLIMTQSGLVPVETLRMGDRVLTRDNGFQQLVWTGQRAVSAQDIAAEPALRPVLIKAGSLGPNFPDRDLMVSPNHRMLVTGGLSQMLFATNEVLVAAKHMVKRQGVSRVSPKSGTAYIHVMCEHHQVIMANGAWTESFQPGDYSLNGIADSQRNEIFALFPELREAEGIADFASSRLTAKRYEAELLMG